MNHCSRRIRLLAFCAILLTSLSVNLPNIVGVTSSLPKYIDEYAVPTPNSAPLAITVDRQGIVWFTESNVSKLGRFDPAAQTFNEYIVPGVGDMWGVTVDEKNYVWLTQYSGTASVNPGGAIAPGGFGRIIRFDPRTKNFTSVNIPTPGSFPMRLTVDNRNRVWFTEFLGNKIGVYDQSLNLLLEFPVPTNSSGPADLTFDENGVLWFTEAYGQKVAKFYPENRTFVEYSVESGAFSPVGVAVDSQGDVWFADHGGNWIVELEPNSKKLTRYPTHFPPSQVSYLSISNGLLIDGQERIWFSEHGGNSIAYFNSKTEKMVEFSIPTGPISTALWIALAPSGDVWFAEWDANKIGVVHSNMPITISLSVSAHRLRIQAGNQTSLSLLVKASQQIEGNGTFRYTWTSYYPEEISATFMPQYPKLSETTGRVELRFSNSIRPGSYVLGIGIDTGTVRVWNMIRTEVISHEQASTPIIESSILLVVIFLLLAAALVGLYKRTRSRHD